MKHGIDPSVSGGHICIEASTEDDNLHIRITDTGIGINTDENTRSGAGGSGTGLGNVRQRLRSLYEERASMRISDNTPSGVVIDLIIPGETV